MKWKHAREHCVQLHLQLLLLLVQVNNDNTYPLGNGLRFSIYSPTAWPFQIQSLSQWKKWLIETSRTKERLQLLSLRIFFHWDNNLRINCLTFHQSGADYDHRQHWISLSTEIMAGNFLKPSLIHIYRLQKYLSNTYRWTDRDMHRIELIILSLVLHLISSRAWHSKVFWTLSVTFFD